MRFALFSSYCKLAVRTLEVCFYAFYFVMLLDGVYVFELQFAKLSNTTVFWFGHLALIKMSLSKFVFELFIAVLAFELRPIKFIANVNIDLI